MTFHSLFKILNCSFFEADELMRVSSLIRSLVLVIACGVFTPCTSQAANISASSSGYGLDAHLSALGLNVDAGPLPVGASGTAPAPYNQSQTTLNVSSTGNILGVISESITANAVTGTATSDVDGLTGVRTTSATGGVVGANIGSNTLSVTLLGLNGTMSSSAQISGDFGSLVTAGSTNIQSLGLTINGIGVNLAPYVGVAVPANTSINLAALGIANSSLILNEQIVTANSITVNALHLSVNLVNLITANVVLGHSQAQMTAVSIPEPACASLFGIALVCNAGVRRRRS
jgi:hypothetical protein